MRGREIREIEGEFEAEYIAYVDKVEKISLEDREYFRSELAWLAEFIRKRYPAMNYSDLRKFINDMITVSV